MHCKYCGKRLSLLRKISSTGFCTQEHLQSYQQEQESLALARLIESNPRTATPPRTEIIRRTELPHPAAAPLSAKYIPQTPQPVSAMKQEFTAPRPLAVSLPFAYPPGETGLRQVGMPGADWRCSEFTRSPLQDLRWLPVRSTANPSWSGSPLAYPQPTQALTGQRLLFAQSVEIPIWPLDRTPLPAARAEYRQFTPFTSLPAWSILFSARLVDLRHVPLDIPPADRPFGQTWTALEPRFLSADIHLPQYCSAPEWEVPPEEALEEPVQASFLLRHLPIAPRDLPKSITEIESARSNKFPEHHPAFLEPRLAWAALAAFDPPDYNTASELAAAAAPLPIQPLFPVACPAELSGDRLHLALALRFREVLPTELDGSHPARLENLPLLLSWNPSIIYPQATRLTVPRLRLDSGLFPAPTARLLDPARPDSEILRPELVFPSASLRYSPSGLPLKVPSVRASVASSEVVLAPAVEGSRPVSASLPALKAQTPRLRTLVPMARPVLCNLSSNSRPMVLTPSLEITEGARPESLSILRPHDSGAILAPAGTALSPDISFESPAAVLADLVPATYTALVEQEAKPEWKALLVPFPVMPNLLLPQANLLITSAAPVVDEKSGVPLSKKAWNSLVTAGMTLPRGARWIAAIVPLAAFLALVPGTNASRSEKRFTDGLGTRWQSMQRGIANRAAISFRDDFRSGLTDWTGSGNWTTSWSFDRGGFARPGKLALYKPSLALSDYQFEFSVNIEQKGVGWAFRAKDTRNYHAVKLMVEPGESPTAALVRYQVANGKAGQRIVTRLPLLSRRSMENVRVDVLGPEFAVYVDNRLVDHWTEHEAIRGGIGFFTESGERARVAWVTVTHQSDLIGRLCSWIAPYGSNKR